MTAGEADLIKTTILGADVSLGALHAVETVHGGLITFFETVTEAWFLLSLVGDLESDPSPRLRIKVVYIWATMKGIWMVQKESEGDFEKQNM